jgi:hypothetical protein
MIGETDYIVDLLEKEAESLPIQQNQYVQHLIELGYIPISKVNALLSKDIGIAKAAFIEEAKSSGLFSEKQLVRQLFVDEDEFLSDLLEQVVDIDEGFTFTSLPENGERSLISRMIHYRLDIFGLWPFAIDTRFSIINSVATLRIIGEHAKCEPLEVVNFLADIEKLTERLLSVHPNEKFIVTFKSKIQPRRDLTDLLDRKVKFKKQLIDDFGERNEFIKTLNKHVFNRNAQNIDYAFLRSESTNTFKGFILRLIQVHQWKDGLYEGLLDSDIGEVTIQSILNAIELYNQADHKSVQNFRVLTYIEGGYFLFNALFFLQEYMVEEGAKRNIEDAENVIVDDIMANTQNADNKTMSLFETNVELLKAELAQVSQHRPEQQQGFLKRIYFGMKKFFKKIIGVSKKIFGWIVHFAEKFKGILKKLFSHLFKKLGKGIKAFLDGIKYIVGKKSTITQNENGLIASQMRFDGDSYSIVTGNASGIIESHTRQIRYNVSSMAFALSIVGGVLKIILNALSIISLPMLVFTIIKIFKHISESYQKLELETT